MLKTINKLKLLLVIGTITVNAQQNKSFNISLKGNSFEVESTKPTLNYTNDQILVSSDHQNKIRVYFKTFIPGDLNLKMKVKTEHPSILNAHFLNQRKKIDVKAGENLIDIGTFKSKNSGYQFIEFSSNKGVINLRDLQITGSATNKGLLFSDDANYFYWARRGPSCHLSYEIPTEKNVSYYYNEIKVNKGQDIIGSYFMANGFGEGYFGMQVNSENERRILFSVWSPFVTDDPKSIPEDEKIILIKKGDGVYTGEFGNEGSGGQSYLKYNWKADTTYKFLLKGIPNGDQSTTYTAWFQSSDDLQWKLIASFKRPKTDTYLKRFHSFLENFIPNQGYLTRQVNFNNQWVYDGEWKKINSAKLTVDATYRANQRVDATGGKTDTGYYLKMGGFFNDIETPNTIFNFNNLQQKPNINFNQLP